MPVILVYEYSTILSKAVLKIDRVHTISALFVI